jgi:hypothetical protein
MLESANMVVEQEKEEQEDARKELRAANSTKADSEKGFPAAEVRSGLKMSYGDIRNIFKKSKPGARESKEIPSKIGSGGSASSGTSSTIGTQVDCKSIKTSASICIY